MINNKRLAFNEIKFQYNYSSDLYDTLNSKIHLALILVSIIAGMMLGNDYMLSSLYKNPLSIRLLYIFGTSLIAYGIYYMLWAFKRLTFKTVDLNDLNKNLKQDSFDFYEVVGKKYKEYTDSNFGNYKKKQLHFTKGLLILGTGLIVILLIYFYILIF